MSRISTVAFATLALSSFTPAAFAQTQAPAQADPLRRDSIADVLAQPPAAPKAASTQTAPASPSAPARTFSPSAIADILDHASNQPVAPDTTASIPATAGTAPAGTPGKITLTPEGMAAVRFTKPPVASSKIDPVVLKAEILLDRAHAPPGVIDGRLGGNFAKAVRTFEEVHGLTVDGKLTQAVWEALGADTAEPVLTSYTITAEDVSRPFYPDLPTDYALLAKLPESGFHDAAEMFGERFHMDKRFLQALNPGVDLMVAGNVITVANIAATPLATPVARINVDKGKGQVMAYDAQDKLIVAYPATIGSEELPSPSGSYAVRAVAWHPNYTYDPKKNFQQGTNTQRLTLPPGPNNPVGSVFIALTKPTFGIHGTPDPTKIDKTHSHGCVRLTNWNAQELAHLVKAGVPVNFIDKPGATGPSSDPIDEVLSASEMVAR